MPTSYILFGKRRKLWDTRKREHLKLSKSDYHIKQQSVDFSAYMAHIMECEEAQHTQMRIQYMYLYNKNLYIFANKMEWNVVTHISNTCTGNVWFATH